jgi:predicted metal-binding membrane protein
MSAMPMASAWTALMAAAMMVAMMLPSLAVALWRYDRCLRAMSVPGTARRLTLFTVAYVAVWSTIGLVLFAISNQLCSMHMDSPADRPPASWPVGAIIICAGALQCSRWKARQLDRCRHSALTTLSTSVIVAWREGMVFAVQCALSCSAPMATLVVVGLMNVPMMAVVTAAITVERVSTSGARIARLTGTLALVAGSIICVRAI